MTMENVEAAAAEAADEYFASTGDMEGAREIYWQSVVETTVEG